MSISPTVLAQTTDWPCVQRLVPRLETGQMWSGPPIEAIDQPLPEIQEVARKLVDLKLPSETVAAEVQAFRDRQPTANRSRAMGQLFGLSLDWLNDERNVVIRGIKRFARGQQGLADKIVAETRELQKLQESAAPNAGPIEDLESSRLWDTRIYTDRQRTLTLVCDQPIQLEQRAFAIARIIQDNLP